MENIISGNTTKEKEQELNRLLDRVNSVTNNEIDFLRIAYEQITKLLVDLWRFNEAIEYYI